MLEENSNDLTIKEDTQLNAKIDESLLSLPLDEAEEVISNNIIKADSKVELEKQFDLFNITQSKKNALRVIKLNSLLSKVEDQAIERFEKRPDQISNKELLEYMQVVSGQIDRSKAYVTEILKDKPLISVNNTKNEVNVNLGPQLNRESREKVMDAISALISQVNKNYNDSSFKDLSNESTITEVATEINDENSVNK